MIQKFKDDRDNNQKQQQEIYIKKKTRTENKMKEDLLRRRVEIGVAESKGGVKQEIKALIRPNVTTQEFKKFKNAIDNKI